MNNDFEHHAVHCAKGCVVLWRDNTYGRDLDFSVSSLTLVDEVCDELRAEGSRHPERVDLHVNIIGSYCGEALRRAYGGPWGEVEGRPG